MSDVSKVTTTAKIQRASGQAAAVLSMYQEGRSCLEVIQQISAVRSAFSSIARDILADEAGRCARSRSPEDFDRILKALVELS